MIDPMVLLEPLGDAEPCGPNLEYDADFTELEKLVEGKPDQQIGETIIPGEAPDWVQVQRRAAALLGRTKDLRVALSLTKALVNTEGYAGLAGGLAVMRGLIDGQWDGLHPQLDPDDDNDPTMRMNLLAELSDVSKMLVWVRAAPLVSVRGLGRFGLRELAIASGEMAPPVHAEGSPPSMATIEAAFYAVDLADLEGTLAAAREARQHILDIENLVTERVGTSNAVSLAKTRDLLKQGIALLEKYHATRDLNAGGAPAGDGDGEPDSSGQAVSNAAPAAQRLSGEITSREDVLRALDKIGAYYARYEPASPVPLLLKRCKRLATMSFLDIIRDMAPDGLAQVEVLRGPEEEGSE